MKKNETPLKIVLMAGEASGDFLGASLMRALKKQSKRPIRFFGMGGKQMQAEGLTPFFSYDDLNVLGVTEVFWSVRTILKKINEAAEKIQTLKPDLVVTIDLQGFNKRLAKKLEERSFPLIHYVAPTVWAWKKSRAKKIAPLFDRLLCLYPFEPEYFTCWGLPTTYVGHPLALTDLKGQKEMFFKKFKADSEALYVVVLPGSRPSEISRLLPVFQESVGLLKERFPSLRVIIPTVPDVAQKVIESTKGWPCPVHVLEEFQDRVDAYATSSLAIAASGTVALELARAKLPMIIAYKLSWLSGWIAKKLLKVKYACLLNLIQDGQVVPELLQEKCTASAIFKEGEALLKSEKLRDDQVKKTGNALQTLRHENTYESEMAAQTLLRLVKP